MTDVLRAEYSLLTAVPTAFSPAGETTERSDGAPVQLLCSTELLADAAGSRFVSFFGHLHRPRGQHPSIVARAMPPKSTAAAKKPAKRQRASKAAEQPPDHAAAEDKRRRGPPQFGGAASNAAAAANMRPADAASLVHCRSKSGQNECS